MSNNNQSIVWITGASSGIGRETAIEFAKAGCRVYASSRRINELERLQNELKKENYEIEVFPCNVASIQNVEQSFKKYFGEEGVHCLVNCAGITSFKKAEENSVNEINDIVNTNLLGSIYTIKNVLPKFIEQKEGTIINILSVVTQKIFVKSSVYSASKAGLLAYSKVLREEVRKHNIKVIDVIPGASDTAIWPQDFRSEYGERMMDPKNIARLIVWSFLQKGNLVTEEIVIRPVKGDL